MRVFRPALVLLACGALLAVTAGLVWHGVLPGTWSLRRMLSGREATEAWLRERHAAQRLAAFARTPAPPGAVCFLGSSTIERLPLAELFPGARCVNRAIAGDTAARLRERLPDLLPPAPAGFVLQIGANDLRREGREPEAVAADVEAILARLSHQAPGAPVAVLGLFRPRSSNARDGARTAAFNRRLKALCAEHGATFVPIADALAGPDGRLAPSLAADPHHLCAQGARRLAARLREASGPLAPLLVPSGQARAAGAR